MSEVQTAIMTILGADNEKRKQSEEYLKAQRHENPSWLIDQLFTLMKSNDANLAQFACVYIKREFVSEDSGLS